MNESLIIEIVLLIYEYMIAVETSFVQDKKNKTKHVPQDIPIADRLDRNFLGFDQDYYERMPLLINDLQEISYTDSETRIRSPRRHSKYYTIKPRVTSTVSNRFVRRTSPRPFIFEYRSPYPMPFSKTNGGPKYLDEQYRNAQRLKNLHDVVKYLEKTLNAKFGDIMYPAKSQVTFSDVYVAPVKHKVRADKQFTNHYSDPLHIFRPDNPGDINLLADGLRFAPIFLSKVKEDKPEMRYTDYQKQNCAGSQCLFLYRNSMNNVEFSNSEEVKSTTENNSVNKFRTFNMFSSESPYSEENTYNNNDVDKIYFTTSRPVFQFKRKSTVPLRRISYKSKYRPKLYEERKKIKEISKTSEVPISHNYYTLKSIDDIVNLTESKINYIDTTTSNSNENIGDTHIINYPKLNFADIEDYHIGSSGVIPIENRAPPSFIPIVTPNVPLSIPYTTEAITTTPPELFKFSPEDAKVPDHYLNIRKSDIVDVTESVESQFTDTESTDNNEEHEHEANTLIVKLRNIFESTSEENDIINDVASTATSKTKYDEDIETTTGTYVPQINGHCRHVKQKSLVKILEENSEKYRKKKIESLITTRNPTYVPMYVEINRHRNTTVND